MNKEQIEEKELIDFSVGNNFEKGDKVIGLDDNGFWVYGFYSLYDTDHPDCHIIQTADGDLMSFYFAYKVQVNWTLSIILNKNRRILNAFNKKK